MLDNDLSLAAGKRFERARYKAFWHKVLGLLTGRDNHLVPWSQAQKALNFEGETSVKLETVPIDQIVGTVGRYEDFDRTFLPTHDSLFNRWRGIDQAFETGIALPPVQLYRVGDSYFVADGHHRVSVARHRGMRAIEALVTEVKAKVPVSGHLDASELAIRGEYTRFLERTGLEKLRPGQCIELTISGAYDRLLAHISAHVPETKDPSDRAVWEQAVCSWYDHTYMPLIQIIREQDILAGFPGRTEADLYLWLVDNQAELESSCGTVDPERAADHFAERHGRRILTRAAAALHDWLSQDACELVASGDEKA